ncbi:Hsp90 binding co-chaperone (Sba1), putative [Penicillium digitatum]|uniref:Hsp90 binding co-chaperone (Sba1), putative n=2 Tax=Penicillium digitatum TaxID=36651 RepID=K9FXD0_PEND1|nr:Hsp90 binding co-chaperone (Sba1), putative [Penicillium digitatum Pd1]EKV05721.1 Hsp90 binding co-chaperone (Sba1), putative [Penicillium digitatum Pd1]QQK40455.1 Hsp90 binding co-chaperone (Sba1), putative [Penicillium digitatum]
MSQALTPEVTWAQRSSDSDPERNFLYVNIKVAEVPKADATLSITEKNVSFKGTSRKGVTYNVSLDLFAEIDPENSKVNHTDRDVELVLRKKELKEEFWPRLLENKQKMHFLKTNFDKWVDEDEQDEAGEDDYANNFGGFGGEGGGDPSAGAGGLGNIDFSKLGGMAGMGGMGGMPDLSALADGMGGIPGDEGAEEDDEDLPELEEAEGQKSTKIQEVS